MSDLLVLVTSEHLQVVLCLTHLVIVSNSPKQASSAEKASQS